MQINLNPTSERGASRDAVNRPRETFGDSHLISSDPRSRFGLVCDLLCCRGNSDDGPEFVAQVVRSWLEGTGSGPLYVAPGSPWQNGYAESFYSKVRDEFLDREEFESEPQARALGALEGRV